jgi:methionyl-tRNA formyltransferase
VFFGTPEFAVPALRSFVSDQRFNVVLVVTQPDRPAGRGHRLSSSPVKVAALELRLPIYQPSSLRTEAERLPLVEVEADLFVVSAFGLIFGLKTLAIPKLGCVNLHASLLPKYRGASPIAAAIGCGEGETGISVMQIETGLDTGPVIGQSSIDISPEDTTESLTKRLADLSASIATDNVWEFSRGERAPSPQSNEGATLTRPLTKSDGRLDWNQPAAALERWVRAMWPWPRAWTTLNEEIVQIHKSHLGGSSGGQQPGTLMVGKDLVAVSTTSGMLVIDRAQLPGGKPIEGDALVQRLKEFDGTIVGIEDRPKIVSPFVVKV